MPVIPPLPADGEIIECWDRNGTSCYYFRRSYISPSTGRTAYYQNTVAVTIIKQPVREGYAPRIINDTSIVNSKTAAEHAAAIGFDHSCFTWTRWSRDDYPTVFSWLDAIRDGWVFPKPERTKFPEPKAGQVLHVWDPDRPSEREVSVYVSNLGREIVLLEHGFDDFEDGGDEEFWHARPKGWCLTDTLVDLGYYPDDNKYMLEDCEHRIEHLDNKFMEWFQHHDKSTGRLSIPPRRRGVVGKLLRKPSKGRRK